MATPERTDKEIQPALGCATLFVIPAFSLIVAAINSCDFVTVTGIDPNGNTDTFTRGISKGQEGQGTMCGPYSASTVIDGQWKASMWMGNIAAFFGTLAVLPIACACGTQVKGAAEVKGVAVNCIWACLFSGLTFLFNSSSACTQAQTADARALTGVTCSLNRGARMNIAACVLFFVSTCTAACMSALANAFQEIEQEQEEEEALKAAEGEEAAEEAAVERAEKKMGSTTTILRTTANAAILTKRLVSKSTLLRKKDSETEAVLDPVAPQANVV